MKRSATATWHGNLKEGKGHLSTTTNTLNSVPYTYGMRYENAPGTNPEELIASAHAGCFTMKLSALITKAGFTPEEIETKCEITFDAPNNSIASSHLTVHAKVSGLSNEKFTELVEDAKVNCPVSKVLKAEITVESKLNVSETENIKAEPVINDKI